MRPKIIKIVWKTKDSVSDVYKIFLNDLTDSIKINSGNKEKLEELRRKLLAALAECDSQLTAIRYPNIKRGIQSVRPLE